MPMVTRQQIEDAVHPECVWTVRSTRAAIGARFPGSADVDLAALIDAWLADESLSQNTLSHCLIMAAKLAGMRTGGAWSSPRKRLIELRAKL